MRLFHMPPARTERPTATRAAETRLRGRWLLLARLLWLVVALCTVALFVANVPVALDVWQRICPGEFCAHAPLPAADAQYLQAHGVSLSARATYWVVESVLFALGYMGMGVFIFWRRSDDWLALMLACYLMTNGAWFSRTSGSLSVDTPGWFWPGTILHFLGQVTIVGFICLFPTGRFAPRWAPWVAALSLLAAASLDFYFNNPLNSSYLPWPFWFLPNLGTNVLPVLVALARYRSGMTLVQRQQIKWALVGSTTGILGYTGLSLVFGNLPDSVWRTLPLPFWFGEGAVEDLLLLLIPLSFGMAILRSHLWDIDLLIKRSLVYGLLTACIIGLYVLLVGGLGALFAYQDNIAISLFATGLVAVLFQPLRQWLQRGVNRLLYGQRDEPYQVLARLGRQLVHGGLNGSMMNLIMGSS